MAVSASVQQFLQLMVLGIVSIVIPVLAYQSWKFLKSKSVEIQAMFSVNQLYLFQQFVAIAVKAMEQAKLKEQLEATAEDLLAEAVGIVQSFLDAHGMSQFSVSDIEAAIRAALRDGLQKGQDEDVSHPVA